MYGQEINLITSAIARMNMFLHGFDDFHVARGDTLSNPAFTEDDRVKQFDIVIANPPYSIKQWNRNSWQHDPWNRNKYGVPPKGNADYAFFQHILCSMKKESGRCGILYPNGVLERDSEQKMRENIVESDLIECIVGLGKDLFYNSSMESCLVFCKTKKDEKSKGKILFIDAKDEITRERTHSFLGMGHIDKIYDAYCRFENIDSFAQVINISEIKRNNYNLNIRLYVENDRYINTKLLETPLQEYVENWDASLKDLEVSTRKMKNSLNEVINDV